MQSHQEHRKLLRPCGSTAARRRQQHCLSISGSSLPRFRSWLANPLKKRILASESLSLAREVSKRFELKYYNALMKGDYVNHISLPLFFKLQHEKTCYSTDFPNTWCIKMPTECISADQKLKFT